MSTLTLALTLAALAAPQHPTVLLEQSADRITLELDADVVLEPGERVAIYATESRTDPRTGETTDGLRYAGDGRVIWVGGDLAQLTLDHPNQPLEGALVLGPAQGTEPTPWAEPEPVVRVVPVAEPAPPREPAPSVHDSVAPHQSLIATLDWADDGYGSGVGTGSLGWAWVPERGPARVAARLEGLRGARWVAAESGNRKEPWAREPAVGYWLWAEVEAAWIGLAPSIGAAVGVQESGATGGLALGLRSGLPDRGHVRLDYALYGSLGSRWSLTGALPLSDRVRVGPRARIGALPLHEQPPSILPVEAPEPWRQQRADGTVRVTWDTTDALTLTLGGGLAGYDLLFADSGPVLDTAVEVRW